MKEMKTAIGMMILLSSMFFGIVIVAENVSAATVISVGPGQTIQAAIDQAQMGGDNAYIIDILSTYNNSLESGTITVNWNSGNTNPDKSLTIRGPPNKIVLQTQGANTDIMDIRYNIAEKQILIQNIEFLAAHSGCDAIYSYLSNDITIDLCSTTSGQEVFVNGFYMNGGSQVKIEECDVSSFTDYGIKMNNIINLGTNQKGIINSEINANIQNPTGDGIYLYNSQYIRIQDNIIHDNDNGIVIKGCRNCLIKSTTETRYIHDNTLYGIVINDTGITEEMYKTKDNLIETLYIKDNGAGGIHIYNCDLNPALGCTNELKNLHISNVGCPTQGAGIYVQSSKMVDITGSNTDISHIEYGISTMSAGYVTIDMDADSITDSPNVYDCEDWGIISQNSNHIKIRELILRNNGDNESGDEGNIEIFNTVIFEIGGNADDSSYLGIIEDKATNNDIFGIYITNCKHIGEYSGYKGWIRDVELKMDTQDDKYAIYVKDSYGLAMKNVYNEATTDIDNAIKMYNSDDVDIDDIHFSADGNIINGICLYIEECYDVTVGIVTTHWIEHFQYGIYIDNCDGASAITLEVQIIDCDNGITIEESTTGSSSTFAVVFVDRPAISSKIDECNSNAIYLSESSLLLQDFRVSGCGGSPVIENIDGTSNDYLKIDGTASITADSEFYIGTDGSSCLTRDLVYVAGEKWYVDHGGTYQTS